MVDPQLASRFVVMVLRVGESQMGQPFIREVLQMIIPGEYLGLEATRLGQTDGQDPR